ncbi:MAG TPA: hypothetical protein PKY59_05005 [Pyrinomonadaceae bacterium]|nr:hypothetical protein [Pyrinomonadaceae bacterium]
MKNLSIRSIGFLTLLFAIFSATSLFAQDAAPKPDAVPTVSPTVRIGVPLPKGQFSEGVDGAMMSAGIRDLVSQYLQGSNIELVPLEAKLASALADEAKEKNCNYVLNIAVTQKKGGSGGFGMFKKIAPVLASATPLAGLGGSIAGQVAGSVAQGAIYSAANMSSTTKSKDTFTLEYSLVPTTGGAAKASNSLKAKANSDGEDVISPMIEKVAEAILTATTTN